MCRRRAAFRVMRLDQLVASGHFVSVGCASHAERSRARSFFQGQFRISLSVTCQGVAATV